MIINHPRAPSARCVSPWPKLTGMDAPTPGDLVKVADGSVELDGLVFETPSSSKVVVAVVDPARGPLFRTVNPNTLTEREQEGPSDRALRLLVRRTPSPQDATARGTTRGGLRRAGFTRGAAHRPTGR
jgi:hypothetical protein